MRVGLIVSSTLHPLAGQSGVSEREHSSAADFRITGSTQVQVVQKVRASSAKPLDRKNLLHTITFSTSRKFATPKDAFLWALDYDTAFPRAGVLRFDAISSTGTVTSRYMADAVVDPPDRQVIGCTVELSYRVHGGAITTTSP